MIISLFVCLVISLYIYNNIEQRVNEFESNGKLIVETSWSILLPGPIKVNTLEKTAELSKWRGNKNVSNLNAYDEYGRSVPERKAKRAFNRSGKVHEYTMGKMKYPYIDINQTRKAQEWTMFTWSKRYQLTNWKEVPERKSRSFSQNI